MLIDRLQNDMKEAMKARQALRLSVLRLTLSEIKNARIAKGEDLDDSDVHQVLKREVKRREEAAEQYGKGDRADLKEKEEQEAEILKSYLPQQLTGEKLEAAVDAAIQEVGAQSMKEMGRVMKIVMAAHAGQVDGKAVQTIVESRLGKRD
jgi:uncharacterized protein YqeY